MKKHILKRGFILCLLLAFSITLAACGNSTNDESIPAEIPSASQLQQMLGVDDDQVQAAYGPGSEDSDSAGNIWSRTYGATKVNEGSGDLRFIYDENMIVQSISLIFTDTVARDTLESNLNLAFGEGEVVDDATNEGETFVHWMYDNGAFHSEIILSDANGPLQLIMNALHDAPTELPDDTVVQEPDEDQITDEPMIDEMPTSALSGPMAQLLTDVGELPALGETVLDQEIFPYFAFIDYQEGMEGLVSEAMIGSIAHSVVLVQVPDGGDVQAVAAQIKQNADPRKWICVEAEKTIVDTNGNLVVLIMSNEATADAIHQNFLAL